MFVVIVALGAGSDDVCPRTSVYVGSSRREREGRIRTFFCFPFVAAAPHDGGGGHAPLSARGVSGFSTPLHFLWGEARRPLLYRGQCRATSDADRVRSWMVLHRSYLQQ